MSKFFDTNNPEKQNRASLKDRVVRKYLFGNKSNDEIRRLLYDNIYPYNYGEVDYSDIVSRVKDAVAGKKAFGLTHYEGDNVGLKPFVGYPGERDDIFASYLGIPENERHSNIDGDVTKVTKSSYSPTIGNEGNNYYKVNLTEEDKEYLVGEGLKVPIGKSGVTSALSNYFGPHTVSHGIDSSGEYVSYYDKWDLNPFFGQNSVSKNKEVLVGSLPIPKKVDFRYDGESFFEGVLNGDIKYYKSEVPVRFSIPNPFYKRNVDSGDQSLGIGTPVNFYDRVYLNDYYGVKPEIPEDSYYGGYLTPAKVTARKLGGKITKHQSEDKFFDTWKKIYGSKIAKASRDFLLGKDMDLSDEEYREKYGYNKPNNSVGIMGMLVAPEWAGVENLTKGISGFGGAKYNAGLEALEAERQAQKALKVYDTMTKRDAFLKERFGKVWKDFTPEEQYGLSVRFRDKWMKDGGVIIKAK